MSISCDDSCFVNYAGCKPTCSFNTEIQLLINLSTAEDIEINHLNIG